MIWRVLTFTGVGLAAGWVGFLAADRNPPIQVFRLTAINSPVDAGTSLLTRWTLFRTRNCQENYDRAIFDSENTRFVLQSRNFKAPPGPLGNDAFTTLVEIPEQAAKGPALYRVQPVFYCNPFHLLWPITIPVVTLKFDIS